MNPLDPAIIRQARFIPPYCPNEGCPAHLEKGISRFGSKGWVRTKNYPYHSRRFRCALCRRSFTYSYFKLDYQECKKGLYPKILFLHWNRFSNCRIARTLRCSEHAVRRKLHKAAQWAFLRHGEFVEDLKIFEHVVFDGLENFARSQYEPNQILHGVGADSLFIYDFSFSPMNRKGRRSARQRIIEKFLDEQYGRFPRDGVRKASGWVLKRLMGRVGSMDQPLVIRSDCDRRYEENLRKFFQPYEYVHIKVPSTDTRNFQNQLHAVNHTDLLVREHSAAFSRETISFAKTHQAMVGKYMLFSVWKNYFRPQFVKKHRRRPHAHRQSPAMALGLTKHLLRFHEFFDIRPRKKAIRLCSEWQAFHDFQPTIQRIPKKAA